MRTHKVANFSSSCTAIEPRQEQATPAAGGGQTSSKLTRDQHETKLL